MASDAYHHGARINETSDAPLSLTTISTAVIGMVATSTDADAATFPFDTPVLLTRAQDGIAKAGTKGTLAKSLQDIANLVSCPVVVVRVAEGMDDAATISNIIGTTDENGRYTGLKALLTAQQRAGVRPRILGVPGFDDPSVTTALATTAKKLNAFCYATCGEAKTIPDVLAYRKTFGQRELMLIWPEFTGWDTTANATVKRMTTAIAMGLRAQIDQTTGWHKTISNVPVDGVTGISADVFFDYLTEGTDADILNAAGVTTLINRNGFRFWGSRTCDDGDFVFESSTRTAQVIKDTIGEGVFEYSDKPMHASLVRDITESINAKFRDLVSQGKLLGAKCWFDPAKNSKDRLMGGGLTISYNYTPVPPLEDLTLQQTFTDEYVADLVAAITATNNA